MGFYTRKEINPVNILSNLYKYFLRKSAVHKNYDCYPESNECLRIQSAHLFCCTRSFDSGFQCDFENCFMQLYVGPCQVVSADCGVRGVVCFLQADEVLGYLARETCSRVELFYCTKMHARIQPGRHKPFCVSNSIGTSSSILRTVRTWHRRIFSCFQNEGAPCW